jgi:hypothetical protein
MAQTTDPLTAVPSVLTDEQLRGAACIACGLPVWTAGAVDLGEHQDPDGVRVFPRAHADCLPGGAA